MTAEQFDVVIIGAGLSGVGTAHHLKTKHPSKRFVIFEARDAVGGTWDLFRYPGIRSDSDMFTLGYGFKPWRGPKAIAEGASILSYIREAAEEGGLQRHLRLGNRVVHAAWSSTDARWTLTIERASDGAISYATCRFVFTCTGYYNYDSGFTPEFPGLDQFMGQVVHPQAWPAELDYAGKRVVVIGSGATAVTLVPALAAKASHVIMLQRTPTYVVSLPTRDRMVERLRATLPAKLAYRLVRWRNVAISMFFYNLARRRPQKTRARIEEMARRQLGPDFDVATHFSPPYQPWDQRLCIVPDGDLFKAIRNGRASVTTGRISGFTETGLRLESGGSVEADLVVTATGLRLQLLGGMTISVDGEPIDMSQKLTYRGCMYNGVPNLATAFGYTNASWTLKCDLTADYVCRLLRYMDRHGFDWCTPGRGADVPNPEPLLSFSSGYVTRSISTFPKQGPKTPWRVRQNYALDVMELKLAPINDGVMAFHSRRPDRSRARAWRGTVEASPIEA